MSKINCPYCDHKPFRNDTGLDWHLKRFHSGAPIEKEQKSNHDFRNAEMKQQHQKFEQTIEKINSRLDVHTKRDSWLSNRIEQIEERTKNKAVKFKCNLQQESHCTISPTKPKIPFSEIRISLPGCKSSS